MPKHFDISTEDVNTVKGKPYEGDSTGQQSEGYFEGIEEGEPTPGTEAAMAMPEDKRREQMQDFAYTIVEGIAELLEAADTPLSFTEPERQNLGEHWGNVLFHYWQIKSRKGLDVANATAYTSGLGVKKAKEIKDKKRGKSNVD